jgi:hypothetical protein
MHIRVSGPTVMKSCETPAVLSCSRMNFPLSPPTNPVVVTSSPRVRATRATLIDLPEA